MLLQKLVRMKAANEYGFAQCVTCGKTAPWQELQGGHYIPRQHKFHKLREENIHPQCVSCNGFKKGAMAEYTLFMIDYYGRDFVDWLWATKKQIHKIDRTGLVDLRDEIIMVAE